MPLHSAPFFRWLEATVLEPSGIFKTQDSVGYTRITDAEAAGIRPPNPITAHRTVLADQKYVHRGTQYTPS